MDGAGASGGRPANGHLAHAAHCESFVMHIAPGPSDDEYPSGGPGDVHWQKMLARDKERPPTYGASGTWAGRTGRDLSWLCRKSDGPGASPTGLTVHKILKPAYRELYGRRHPDCRPT